MILGKATNSARSRFTTRRLFYCITVTAIISASLSTILVRPYRLTGTHPNGVRAWEQWEKYTWSLQPVSVKTIRYYSNSQKSMESKGAEKRYWDPSGQEITASEFFKYFVEDGGEVPRDTDSHRPLSFWFGD